MEVAAACITAGGGSVLDKRELRQRSLAMMDEGEEITHVILQCSVLKALGEKERRKVGGASLCLARGGCCRA